MTEELLQDLAEYKTYKDKGVMMASRSLIALFRSLAPELLHKKDRGRPTEATTLAKMKQYGESEVVDFIAGAEVLDTENNDEEEVEEEDESGEEDEEDEEENDNDDEEEEIEGEGTDNKNDVLTLEEKTQKARDATVGRILSDEDFRKIAAAQLRKQVEGVRKVKKTTQKGRKRKAEEANIDDDDDWNNVDEEEGGREELVNLDAIEMVHKKKKHDKEARLATVIAGREGREKFGHISKKGPGASMTNKQKAKKKNFSMMKHKIKAKGKKSFREKQVALKKRLLKSQKFK